jgi:hypothetical protein
VDGVTGGVFSSLDQMLDGLPAVVALGRASVRARTVARFGVETMLDAYEELYTRIAAGTREAAIRPHDLQRDALASRTGL